MQTLFIIIGILLPHAVEIRIPQYGGHTSRSGNDEYKGGMSLAVDRQVSPRF